MLSAIGGARIAMGVVDLSSQCWPLAAGLVLLLALSASIIVGSALRDRAVAEEGSLPRRGPANEGFRKAA